MLKKKPISLINNKIGEIAHKFAIQNKIKLLGSNSFRGLLHPSDYDFTSDITEPIKALAKHLQQLFSKKLPFIILDFKCGLDTNGDKLRWSAKQLKKGFNKKSLEDALKDNTIIKLDYAVKLGNLYFENSIIFNTKYQTEKSKKQIENELENEITEYSKINSMKSLKRLFSLLKLQKKHASLQKKLITFFNSDVGLANKIANDLDLFLLIIEKYKLPLDEIVSTTQMIKEKLSTIAWINPESLNTINKSNYKQIIEEQIKHIRSKINPLAQAFLKSNYI